MALLCQDCPERNQCKELCEAVEDIANLDYIKQHDLPVPDLVFAKYGDLSQMIGDKYHGVDLTKTEKKILTLIGCGLTRLEIGELLQIQQSTVRWHIGNIQTKTQKPNAF